MRRLGWHLDDVPQPYLSVRRTAFVVVVLVFCGAAALGVVLGYDITHHQGPSATFFIITAVMFTVGGIAGGIFATTNKRSARWREWRRNRTSLTPGWPPSRQI